MKPPKHLRPSTREWWAAVVARWELDPHHIMLLTRAAEAWDRTEQAREILATEGVVVRDRWGQVKQHPCIAVENMNRTAFRETLRELDLDTAASPEGPRPPVAGRRR